MSNKWHCRFMRLAKSQVSEWSKDPDKKVGCVIVSPDRRQMTFGYNGFPTGVEDSRDRLDDHEVKNALSVHAELNAILNARTNLTGWTLYCTEHPCHECAKSIIQAGIVHVVCPPINEASRWAENQRWAKMTLLEAGVSGSYLAREKFE